MNGIKKVPGLYDVAVKILQNEMIESRRKLDRAEKAWKILTSSSHQNITFEVTLHSLWSNEGESNVVSKSRRGLKEVLKQAQSRFKRINNNRRDVQAKYTVKMYFGTTNQFWIVVPEHLYEHLK